MTNTTQFATALDQTTLGVTDDQTALTIAERKLARSSAKASLDDFVASKTRRTLLLCDCSGSMGETIGGTDPVLMYRTKIDEERRVVAEIKRSHPGGVPVAAFGHRGNVVELVDTVPAAAGMTPLHLGIDYATLEQANHLLVITDGQPDSQDAAFASAVRFGGVIDVCYIGLEFDPYTGQLDEGLQFSQELSRRTGGTCSHVNIKAPKALQGAVIKLLGDGSDSL